MSRLFPGWMRMGLISWSLYSSLTLHAVSQLSRPVITPTSARAPHTTPAVSQAQATASVMVSQLFCVILFTGNSFGAIFFIICMAFTGKWHGGRAWWIRSALVLNNRRTYSFLTSARSVSISLFNAIRQYRSASVHRANEVQGSCKSQNTTGVTTCMIQYLISQA